MLINNINIKKDIFISHAWGINEINIDNHLRCKELCNKLINSGYSVWFDDNEMIGNIDNNIIKGINSCQIILVCLTEKYINKINDAVNFNKPNDNCYKEWNYALFKNKIFIPIIMEEKMKNIFLHQDGVIQMYLSSMMYIDFSENLDDEYDVLLKTIRKYGIYNKTEKISLNIKPENSFEKLNKLLKAYNNYSPKNSPKNSLKNSPKIQNKNIILTEKKITNRMLLFDYLKFNYFIKSNTKTSNKIKKTENKKYFTYITKSNIFSNSKKHIVKV